MRNCTWSLLLYLCSLLCQLEAVGETSNTLEQVELQQCGRNLHLIHEAIQAYRRANKELPNELTDLAPQYLSVMYLICPASGRLGLTSTDIARWGADGPIMYAYEFSTRPIPPNISGGSQRSMREWKQLQMGLIGSEVPMVRCLIHEHAVLNLTFGGQVFESEQPDWEESFAKVVNHNDLTFPRCFGAYTIVKKIVVPTRSADALPTMIDLSSQYNVLLDEPWPSFEPLRPLAALPAGVVEFNGTRFDVRGTVQLGAMRPGLIAYPAAVTNILIGMSGRQVQLLVGTVYSAAPESEIAACVFKLANGHSQRLRLCYGAHVEACVSQTTESVPTPRESKVAWSSIISDGRVGRLYQCKWTNPEPGQTIKAMDFLARTGDVAPLLVALSIE